MTNAGNITPDEVLYDFDGPQIFVKKYGPLWAFYLKIVDDERRPAYLETQIELRKIEAIKSGQISVRSAFMHKKEIQVVVTDPTFGVVNRCAFKDSPFGESVLPDSGVGLSPLHKNVPDAMISQSALLSIYFRGEGLREDTVDFARFANLTFRTLNVVKRMFLPREFWSKASNYLNISIGEPEFGSLMFSINDLEYDSTRWKRSKFATELKLELTREIFEQKTSEIARDFNQLKSVALGSNMDSADLQRLVGRYDVARDIFPRRSLGLDEVHFFFEADNSVVTFGAAECGQLDQRILKIKNEPVSISGKIVEINQRSNTFIIEPDIGRQTTCKMFAASAQELGLNSDFKIGSQVGLFGRLTVRSWRDWFEIERINYLRPA